MATSNNALISVRQLTKEFRRGVVALDHCDLEVHRGEVVAIIGPSGSGKSTLLRSLNLLEQPTSGVIYFDGADLADKSVNIDRAAKHHHGPGGPEKENAAGGPAAGHGSLGAHRSGG